MDCISVLVLCLVVSGSWCSENFVLPSDFKLGVGTSAYQIEGAWNASDKSESIWDRLCHTRANVIMDGSNGDVACDSYHLWQRDVEMLEELGVDMYRFSISWSRLLPSGFTNHISEDGRLYYNNLINSLLDKGIEPVVTLHHFDLPQSLQDLGGWANPLIPNWFADYASVVFSIYGDRVKTWLTINEPLIMCDGIDNSKVAVYLCNKHVLLAHAKAYRIYDELFRNLYHGKVSLSNLVLWLEPENPADEEVTELMIQMWEGRFAHPIFSKTGGWPPALEKFLNENSRREGYSVPRLPPFTREETDLVRGTYDFYALTHYTTRLVRKVMPGFAGSWPFYGSEEIGASLVSDPSWRTVEPDLIALNPEGLRKQLHWINSTYGVNEILITENGLPLVSKDLLDYERLAYIKSNLEQVLLAINDGAIKVLGYISWSLMDNFQWTSGYSVNIGLYAVNFSSPQRTRSPRESARYLSGVTKTRSIHPLHHGLSYARRIKTFH